MDALRGLFDGGTSEESGARGSPFNSQLSGATPDTSRDGAGSAGSGSPASRSRASPTTQGSPRLPALDSGLPAPRVAWDGGSVSECTWAYARGVGPEMYG